MTIRRSLRYGILGLGLTALAGCSTLSSIQSASTPLDTFELTPLPAGVVTTSRSRRQLEVALPTATGALSSDRILIKPTALQIASLPDARWVNETTELVQLLLVRSLANSDRFALVTSAGLGPPPDFVLMTDLRAFQAEVINDQITVVISSTITLLRDTDDIVISSRRFTNSSFVTDTNAESLVAAFDQVMTRQLADVVAWIVRSSGS
jgi:cholesterol transport system auxiliary component